MTQKSIKIPTGLNDLTLNLICFPISNRVEDLELLSIVLAAQCNAIRCSLQSQNIAFIKVSQEFTSIELNESNGVMWSHSFFFSLSLSIPSPPSLFHPSHPFMIQDPT